MLRSAAKNFASVWVIADPNDYGRVHSALTAGTTMSTCAGCSPERRTRTRRRTTRRSRRGSRASAATSSRRRSSCRSSARSRCATAKIPGRRRRSTSSGRRRARRTDAARRQGAFVQQSAGPRGRAAGGRSVLDRDGVRDREAHDAVRARRRHDGARRVQEGAGLRPRLGLRLGDRVHGAGRRRDRERRGEPLRRMRRGAGVQRGRDRDPRPQEEPARPRRPHRA